MRIGLEHYEPLKLADEEVELARLKRQEAYRAFYPALSMKAERTEGETADPTRAPNFIEKMYGASLSQSLFEGGKIAGTYQQSLAAHVAAEKNREKVYHDFVYNVAESYWKLVSTQNNLNERESVKSTIKNDLKIMTEQYVLDLAVKQQFLAVKAQYLNANNQANGARIAYSKARWNLAKALGLPRPPDFDVAAPIPYKKIDVQLEPCLLLAAGHRPDLSMQKYLMEVARRGRQVASSARFPKFVVSGFYGKSAAAYETDPLEFREDWQLSARVSQAFLGNSIGLTGSDIKTSPKIGQSTRTRTKTEGVSLNLLDGLKDRTEMKQSDLAFRQADLKLRDLEKEVAMDVEEAFYDLNQAILQVEFTDEDLKLAEEELHVAESKGKYGLSSLLELAQARNRLAGSRVARMDALAATQIAVAALNRAVGIVDRFKVE